MKDFISREVRPTTMQQLIQGILEFWHDKVTVDYCNSKINHLDRVIKTCIALNGRATGL